MIKKVYRLCLLNNRGGVLCEIITENGELLKKDASYTLLKISSNLHFLANPSETLELIFDILEQFTHKFESRILTINKQIFGEREYNILNKHIRDYKITAQKKGIELGGSLIERICS